MGERPDVFPPIAAFSEPEPRAGFARQFPHGRACEALVGRAFQHGLGPFVVAFGSAARSVPYSRLCAGGTPKMEPFNYVDTSNYR